MARKWEDLSKDDQEDIRQTLKKQRECEEIEGLMNEELDKCQK